MKIAIVEDDKNTAELLQSYILKALEQSGERFIVTVKGKSRRYGILGYAVS